MIGLPADARLDARFPLIVQTALLEAECWLSLSHDLSGRTIEAIMKACNVVNALVLAACVMPTSNAYAQASNAMPTASSSATSSGKATPSDKQLARDVRKALSKVPNFNVSNVFVKARGGVVTLSGSVPDGPQIQQAADVANGVPGVVSVNNHLALYTKGY
jgi:hyperosmotically inducible protein